MKIDERGRVEREKDFRAGRKIKFYRVYFPPKFEYACFVN